MTLPAAGRIRTKPGGAQWRLLVLLVISIFINYIDRSNLSVAAPQISAELGLNFEQLGKLFSAFFWTYAICLLAGGWLVDRFSVYWVYGAGFLFWSLATAFTGLVSSYWMLFGLRLVLGAGESVAYPSYSKIIAEEFPEERRGICNALIDAGSKMGPALGTLVGGLVVARFGWRALFLGLGVGALLWLMPWAASVPAKARGTRIVRAEGGPGLLDILKTRAAWGTFFGLFSINWAWYFLLTWLPTYLVKERHYSMEMMAIVGSLPFWGIAASAISGGLIADRWVRRGGTPTRVRKTFAISGLLLCTLMLPASLIADNTLWMVLFTIACLSFGLCTGTHWAITQRLAGPGAAGKWTGLENAFGNIAGITAPWITGMILARTGSFYWAFVTIAIVLVIGATGFGLLVGKVEPIDWEASKKTA